MTPRTRYHPPSRDYAAEITAAWRATVDGIFKTGELLAEAKKSLPRGAWKDWVGDNLRFSYATVNRLINIAKCEFLRNVAHAQLLPSSYTVLAELAALKPSEFERALAKNLIRPDMLRFDANQLKRSKTHAVVSYQNNRTGKKPGKAERPKLYTIECGPEDRLCGPDEGTDLASARTEYFNQCRELDLSALETEKARCNKEFETLQLALQPEQIH